MTPDTATNQECRDYIADTRTACKAWAVVRGKEVHDAG